MQNEIECPKCKSKDVIVYWDKVKADHNLFVCQNKSCANAGMKYDFDKGK